MSHDDSSKSAEKSEEVPSVYIPAGVYRIEFKDCKWEWPEKKPNPPEEKAEAN
jgi:hypothetical protein